MEDKFFISGGADNLIKLWDFVKGYCFKTLKGHTEPVRVVLYLDCDEIASAGDDKTVKIWDNNGNLMKTIVGH